MSVKLRKSSPRTRKVDKPFSPAILAQGRKRAAEYQVVLHCEDGHWYGRGLELPHVFGDGKTPEACVENTRQALLAAVCYLLETDKAPPAPATGGRRTEQVNVRLSVEEKLVLESTAKRKGFQGISDFLRAAGLNTAH
jgi:predicted RNase H-like HicB family nuclease